VRLCLVPARGRVLEEQPDALAALLPGPVVARRRERQVAQDTFIQRPPDRPRCLHALGDDRLAVGSRADESIRGRLLPIAQHFDRVRHACAVRECDPRVHGRVPVELTPEARAGASSDSGSNRFRASSESAIACNWATWSGVQPSESRNPRIGVIGLTGGGVAGAGRSSARCRVALRRIGPGPTARWACTATWKGTVTPPLALAMPPNRPFTA